MYIMTLVLKTSHCLLLVNIIWYTFPNKPAHSQMFLWYSCVIENTECSKITP